MNKKTVTKDKHLQIMNTYSIYVYMCITSVCVCVYIYIPHYV